MTTLLEQPCVGCLTQADTYVPALIQIAQGPVCVGHLVKFGQRAEHREASTERVVEATIAKLDGIGQALASQASSETNPDRRQHIQQLRELVSAASTREQRSLEALRAGSHPD